MSKCEKYSEILKALGHPVRLKIISELLSDKECNVNKIVEDLKIPQSTASQHLAVLRSRNIIASSKHGVSTCYYVIDEKVKEIIKIISC